MNNLHQDTSTKDPVFLIFGSSGFIGSHLENKLQSNQKKFITINRSRRQEGLFTLKFSSSLRENYDLSTKENNDFEWSNLSYEIKNFKSLTNLKNILCFHLSSYGVLQRNQDLHALVEGNILLSLRILELCKEIDTERIIQTGSCAEYAPSACDEGFLNESSLCASESLYGVAKHASLSFARAYCKKNKLEWIGLRLFGVYGFGEHEDRLLPFIFKKILAKESNIPLTGGQQLRDFTYIEDMVDAIYLAATTPIINNEITHPSSFKEINNIFNVCSGIATSVKHMARLAAHSAGIDETILKFGAVPYRPDEAMQIVGNPKKFFEWTKWKSSTQVEDGVKKFWEIYKQNKDLT